MRILAIASVALTAFFVANNICNAQVLKQEPPPGTVPAGKTVLVDDGTCGAGKIKQITGGRNDRMNPMVRTSTCIAKR